MRGPNPYRSGGRSLAELTARSLVGCIVPPTMPHMTTSFQRRWSQICRVKMPRTSPHPRPWDGPQFDFSGAFFGNASDGRLFGSWIE